MASSMGGFYLSGHDVPPAEQADGDVTHLFSSVADDLCVTGILPTALE